MSSLHSPASQQDSIILLAPLDGIPIKKLLEQSVAGAPLARTVSSNVRQSGMANILYL